MESTLWFSFLFRIFAKSNMALTDTIFKVTPWEMAFCQEINRRTDTTLKVPHYIKIPSPEFPNNNPSLFCASELGRSEKNSPFTCFSFISLFRKWLSKYRLWKSTH